MVRNTNDSAFFSPEKLSDGNLNEAVVVVQRVQRRLGITIRSVEFSFET